jgi:hypothetical protein
VGVFLLAAPPSCPLSLCPLFQDGWTALIYASENGHAEVVELLLAAKADPNLKNNVSHPPLPPQREREDERPLSPNAYTCPPTLTKGPHVPSRLWA